MIDNVTNAGAGKVRTDLRLKLMLVPKWLERKLTVAGLGIGDVSNQEKLSSILSGDDFRFYTDLQYGAISTLFGEQVAQSFLVSGGTSNESIGEDLKTFLLGIAPVYGYDESTDPFALPFKVTMLATDTVVISQAESTDGAEDVIDQLMKFLTATVGLRVATALPIMELFSRKASV